MKSKTEMPYYLRKNRGAIHFSAIGSTSTSRASDSFDSSEGIFVEKGGVVEVKPIAHFSIILKTTNPISATYGIYFRYNSRKEPTIFYIFLLIYQEKEFKKHRFFF